ncbi:NfeD family protein [Natronoglycomyces albus]|uniref:NfeD family protein n=1 Tax=Natronoglycomyces albus TaxID=2811108 RepID=A0A895XNF9_9ACTN|nr:NfeD family protein [Natronoglycomyces albus]QSB06657.1 NfeD family protein [Natronoglycomyces albus]
MDVLFWILLAVALGVAELFMLTFVLSMVAGGALLAGLAALVGLPPLAQGVVFVAGTGLSLVFVRPFLRKLLLDRTKDSSYGIKALEGKNALVLEQVDVGGGVVELEGDQWTAHLLDDSQTLEPGEQVTVVEIRGATVIVWRQD